MELRKAIAGRYSCRSYEDRAVDAGLLAELVDTARSAPSASNRQEWRFVAVTDKAKITQLTERAGTQKWWAQVPVMIACCAEGDAHVMACGQQCYPIDVAIIMDHLTLLATEAGLATCWVGAFDEDVVKEVCGVPPQVRVVELLALGYPADGPREKTRLGPDKILFSNAWGSPFA
jgi:nitroreductase